MQQPSYRTYLCLALLAMTARVLSASATGKDDTRAEITTEKLGGGEIVLVRRDVAGPKTGLTARCVGRDGGHEFRGDVAHSILGGTAAWTWQGRDDNRCVASGVEVSHPVRRAGSALTAGLGRREASNLALTCLVARGTNSTAFTVTANALSPSRAQESAGIGFSFSPRSHVATAGERFEMNMHL